MEKTKMPFNMKGFVSQGKLYAWLEDHGRKAVRRIRWTMWDNHFEVWYKNGKYRNYDTAGQAYRAIKSRLDSQQLLPI